MEEGDSYFFSFSQGGLAPTAENIQFHQECFLQQKDLPEIPLDFGESTHVPFFLSLKNCFR